MNERKQPSRTYEYNETGVQEIQQQINDAYISGVMGGTYAQENNISKELEEL